MAIKRARIVKMRLDELAAVDVGAQDAQGTVVLKRGRGQPEPTEVKKKSALTTAIAGHTHLVYCVDDSTSGSTSYESTYTEGQQSGCYTGHSHSWVRNEDGSITIGEAMGHTHEIAVVSASLVEKSAAGDKAREGDASKSTRSGEPNKMAHTTEVSPMKIVALTEAQFDHYSKLSGADAEAFVAKTSFERDAEVEKTRATDPVVFKGELTGIEVRKSQGDVLKRMAELAEQNALAAKKATEMAETEKAARETSELRKRAADTLGSLAGTEEAHVDLLRAVDTIADVAKRTAVTEALTAANAAMKALATAPGTNPGSDPAPGDALAEFDAGVAKFAEKNGIKDIGLAHDRFLGTTEGLALKKKYDATRAYGKQ